GVLLGLVNAIVRPVLLILTLPITLVTLGLFLLVLNGLCFWLVASVVRGFTVSGFWAAFLGALVVSVVSWVVTALVSDSGKVVLITPPRCPARRGPPRPPSMNSRRSPFLDRRDDVRAALRVALEGQDLLLGRLLQELRERRVAVVRLVEGRVL